MPGRRGFEPLDAALTFQPNCFIIRIVAFLQHEPRGRNRRKNMPRKTVKYVAKPLPSALTVASSAKAAPVAPPLRLSSAAVAKNMPPSPTRAAAARLAPAPAAARPKPSPPPPLPASPEQATAVAQTQTPAAPRAVHAAFVLFEPEATQAFLCGEFNAWSPAATPMKRQADGHWHTTVALPPGRYQYKFVVDGQWLPDPNAQEFVSNEFGTLNSVMEVRA
jgi:hypothetical protein